MSGFVDSDHYQNQMAYWPPNKEIAQNHSMVKDELSGLSNCNQRYQTTTPSDLSYSRPSCSYQNMQESKESDAGSSHLSFLYDRAQGPCDTPQTSATFLPFSPNQPHPMYHMTNGEDTCQNSTSSGLISRAIPAVSSYPHSPVQLCGTNKPPQTNESFACPTGANNEPKQQENQKNETNFHQIPEMARQISNLNTNDLTHSGLNGHVAGQIPYQNRVEKQRIASETDAHRNEDSSRKPWSYSPQFGNSSDPKNNTSHRSTSKSHPIPDYLSFRKFSVPIVTTRPKVQVADYSSDDQLADRTEMRSLQRASSEVDHSSVHQLLREGDEIGVYHQKSIRYTGRTNPSKIFKLLQAATGTEGEMFDVSAQLAAKLPPRRRVRKEDLPIEKEENNADDVVDISYVGGNIPSRTFRNLREAMGERDNIGSSQSMEASESTPLEQVRTVKVIHLRPRKSIDNGISDF